MSTGRETVGFTWRTLPGGSDGVVNTTFMCIDMAGDETAPMLFETKVVGGNTAAVFDELTRH